MKKVVEVLPRDKVTHWRGGGGDSLPAFARIRREKPEFNQGRFQVSKKGAMTPARIFEGMKSGWSSDVGIDGEPSELKAANLKVLRLSNQEAPTHSASTEPGYLHKLLRNFDEDAYHDVKAAVASTPWRGVSRAELRLGVTNVKVMC